MPVVGPLESGRPGGPMCRSDPGSCPLALQLRGYFRGPPARWIDSEQS